MFSGASGYVNVRSVDALAGGGRLAVVGAEYELETGQVRFFDGVDAR